MTANEFKIWQATAGLSGMGAAEALCVSANTISVYRNQGVPASESARTRLLCAAILAGIEPWHAPKAAGR